MIKDAFDGLIALMISAGLFLLGCVILTAPAMNPLTNIGLNFVATALWVWSAAALAVSVANAALVIRGVLGR